MTAPLPEGFVVRLNDRARVCDGGRTLVGGTPTRAVFLTDTARTMITDGSLRVSSRSTAVLADRLLETGLADPVVELLPAGDPEQLTIVVPVRDRPAALERLLGSIGRNHPVVVVDDCSLDPAPVSEVAAAHGADLLPLPTNVGPAAARNAGLRRVTTAYVAFVDSDVVLEHDTMPTLLRHFTDPRVALVAPRIRGLGDAATAGWVSRYEQARSSLDLGPRAGTVRPRAPVAWVPGACVVARVDALEGGFSPELRVAEDVDLVWRLAQRGWRIRYEPAARVRHEHRLRAQDWIARKFYYGRGAQLLAERHGHDVAPVVLSPWSVGVVAALLAQRWWSLPAAAVVSVAASVRIATRLGRSRSPVRLAAAMTAGGVVSALDQTMALLLRHWWPVTAVCCVLSRRVRRAALVAAVVDAAVEHRRTAVQLDPLRFAIARRLDDLAYGSGVWWGALSGRSARALLPDLRRRAPAESFLRRQRWTSPRHWMRRRASTGAFVGTARNRRPSPPPTGT